MWPEDGAAPGRDTEGDQAEKGHPATSPSMTRDQLVVTVEDATAAYEALSVVALLADQNPHAAADVVHASTEPDMIVLSLASGLIHLLEGHLGYDPVQWAEAGMTGARTALVDALAALVDLGDADAEARLGRLLAADLEGGLQ